MGKRANRVPKTEFDTLLTEATEINKFNMLSRTEDRLKEIKLTQKQKLLFELIKENEIISVTGPAGTSKTFMAIYTGLHFLYKYKNNKIFLTKPIVEAGEKLGFLPGETRDKVEPYLQSYVDLFNEIIGKDITKRLFETQRVEFEPVAYMRGRNLVDSFIIIDEMQNFTMSQLMTLVTRKNYSSKIILLGDTLQNDKDPKRAGKPLEFIEYILKPIRSKVAHFEFDLSDMMRDKIIIDLIENYQAYLNNKK